MSSKAPKLASLITLLALLCGPTLSCGLTQKSLKPISLGRQIESLEAQSQRLNKIEQVMTRDLESLQALERRFFISPPPTLPLDLFRLSAIQCLNTPPSSVFSDPTNDTDPPKSTPSSFPNTLLCQSSSLPLLWQTTPPQSKSWVQEQMQRIDDFRTLVIQVRSRATKIPPLLEKMQAELVEHRIEVERISLDLENSRDRFSLPNWTQSQRQITEYNLEIDALETRIDQLTEASSTWAPQAYKLSGRFLQALVWLGQPEQKKKGS